jgi:hypothetical protein
MRIGATGPRPSPDRKRIRAGLATRAATRIDAHGPPESVAIGAKL